MNNLKKSGTWKNQSTITNELISSIDNDEKRVMHSKSDKIETTINDEADEVIKELFHSLKNRYQNNFESMKDSEFVFHYLHLLYYKCHKINLHRGESYINSFSWIKSKNLTINPSIKKNKCFQYAVSVTLNHEEIKKDPQRITNK